MTLEDLYNEYLKSRTVTTDSRKVTPGCLFFALKGETFDGNAYAAQALRDGAALAIIDTPQYNTDSRCVLVKDVLETLQELARYHRAQLTIPVIGITGTNGKTTTKELVHAVLSRRYRTWATQGNFNNHLGVPLTLLSIPADAEIAVVEMGANHPGEIDFLCNIANPDFGLITNVGKAHLEGFGSFKGVIRTKTELYKHLAAMAGTIFVNADNDILMERAEKMGTLPAIPSLLPGFISELPTVTPGEYSDDFHPRGVNMPMASVVTYGSNATAEFKGALVSANPYLKFYFEDGDEVYTVQTHLLGSYNFDNAMAAVCVGQYFHVELFDIKSALEEYEPNNNRSQFKQTDRNALVLDCYNANPSSMAVAISNFSAMKGENKCVILGSMKELGSDSKREHQELYKQILDNHFSQVILIGNEFRFAEGKDGTLWFPSVIELGEYLQQRPISGATILIKGSNSNKLWTLEEKL